MNPIVTPRLILASTPLMVISTRLIADDFFANVPITLEERESGETDVLRVHFPPEWPGDALALFSGWKAKLEADPNYEVRGGTMIERATATAIGQMSLRVLSDETDDETDVVELGYGVNASSQGRGYATEMAQALVSWATTQPTIQRITSSCLEENAASIRVLEKVGFRRAGDRMDDEGRLILWEYDR